MPDADSWSKSAADTLRLLQEMGGQLAQAARSAAEDLAASPAAKLFEPMAEVSAQIAELSTAWVAPVRAVFDEQQQVIDAIAAWADQQKELAERFAAIAQRHRELSSQTFALLEPLLREAERLRDRVRPGAEPTSD